MSEPPQRPHPPVWPSAQPLPQPQSQRQPQPWPPAWQQPGASIPPGYPAAPPVSAGIGQGNAERSRKIRTWIGVISIIVGAFDLIGTVLVAFLMAAHQAGPAFGDFNEAMVIFGVVQGLAYVGIGVWALVTRRTTRRAPIVSILVLTSIGLLLGLLDVVDSIANGRTPQLGSYVLVAFLFQRAIRVLRLMPHQNPYVVHRS